MAAHMKRKAQECNKIKGEITIINHFSRLTHSFYVFTGLLCRSFWYENSHEELISSRLGNEAKLNWIKQRT